MKSLLKSTLMFFLIGTGCAPADDETLVPERDATPGRTLFPDCDRNVLFNVGDRAIEVEMKVI